MIHAYDKLYLEKARTSLARMLDFAVYDLHKDLATFFDLFIASGVSSLFETGDINTLVGKSGVELAYDILDCCGIPEERISPKLFPTLSTLCQLQKYVRCIIPTTKWISVNSAII